MTAEAIGHALSAPDHERAARLIAREVKQAWSVGEGSTVLRWLEALPLEAKRLRPRLLLQHAQALALTGRPDDAEPLLEEAERAASEATADAKDRRFLLGFASAIRSWRARLRGDAPTAVKLAQRALSLLPEEGARQRLFAALCLGNALRITGDLAAAGEAFAEAVELGLTSDHVLGTLTGMVWQARVQAEWGRLRQAENALRRAARFVTERGVELLPAAGVAHVGMGALLYERNDLEEAERELEEGMSLAERTRDAVDLVWGYVTLSRVKWARGDEEGAIEVARKADRVARTSGAYSESALAANWMVRLRLTRGELAEAVALEQERAANTEAAVDAARVMNQLTSARLLHARCRHREALRLLEELREAAEEARRTGYLIEILTLKALALWATNEKERAVSTLTQALALAEPEGYVRAFVDEGPETGALLSATLEYRQRRRLDAAGRVSTQYIAKLLAVLAQQAAAPGADHRLYERLSERELEVLALISAGKSNKEIARELFLSMSTIKTHINRLYRKLGTRSRTQAVARAREMNLL
jgi:LuxR family maltose regulon positive regulatory protein